jgi:iron complex outermembrane receptor protein
MQECQVFFKSQILTKMVTDLRINYAASDKLTMALNVNNLLNVYLNGI